MLYTNLLKLLKVEVLHLSVSQFDFNNKINLF